MTNMSAIAREIESSRPSPGGDRDIHNLSHVYQELSQIQTRDGGAQSQAFQRDLGQLNQKLQSDGILPNLQITGIDNNGHIATENAQTGQASMQDASRVFDFGPGRQADAAPGTQGDATPSTPLNMMVNAFNIPQNGDGRFYSPADNGPQAAGSVLQTIFNGMLGGGAASQSPDQDANGDAPQLPSAPGLNPILAAAWAPWTETPPDDTPPDSGY